MNNKKSSFWEETKKFTPIKVFKNLTSNVSTVLLIISHLDLDGIVSAYMMGRSLLMNYREIHLILTAPADAGTLAKHLHDIRSAAPTYMHSAVLDLAINTHAPMSTVMLLNELSSNYGLKYVVDHHTGWERFIQKNPMKDYQVIIGSSIKSTGSQGVVLINDGALSCAEVVAALLPSDDNAYINTLREIALLSDSISYRIEHEDSDAFPLFIGLRNLSFSEILTKLVSENLSGDTTWYLKEVEKAEKAAARMRLADTNIGVVQILSDDNINVGILCSIVYKKVPVIIISELNAKKMKLSYTVSTCLPELNLVNVFGLNSGSPHRVSVMHKDTTIEYIVKKVSEALKS